MDCSLMPLTCNCIFHSGIFLSEECPPTWHILGCVVIIWLSGYGSGTIQIQYDKKQTKEWRLVLFSCSWVLEAVQIHVKSESFHCSSPTTHHNLARIHTCCVDWKDIRWKKSHHSTYSAVFSVLCLLSWPLGSEVSHVSALVWQSR